jgi:hypothetical protein
MSVACATADRNPARCPMAAGVPVKLVDNISQESHIENSGGLKIMVVPAGTTRNGIVSVQARRRSQAFCIPGVFSAFKPR